MEQKDFPDLQNHSANQQKNSNLHLKKNKALLAKLIVFSLAFAACGSETVTELATGEEVYEGMIIGEHNRDNDLEVNPLKGKKLTNIRASGNDEAVRLTPPTKLSLEQAIAYIDDDELVEVTPNHIRLRKQILTSVERKRSQKIAS